MFMRYSRSYDKLERIKVVVGSLSKTTVEEVSASVGNSNEVAPKSTDSIEKIDSYKEVRNVAIRVGVRHSRKTTAELPGYR